MSDKERKSDQDEKKPVNMDESNDDFLNRFDRAFLLGARNMLTGPIEGATLTYLVPYMDYLIRMF